ncbi:MAG: RNA polymerase sigma-70 factor [Salinivirgaceae bacterium]|jgi:RNA polymerase sigma-70 factor (ECF subfamily)|nr:RNA polymerase sigma-70 factor [Salinivirgaceae bacterium]
MVANNDTILKQKLEALFHEHFTPLVYFAQKYLGDLDSSKEVVHNVFVKIWENRNEFEFDKPAKSYLFTSVYNRSMNAIRDKKKFVNSEDDEVHAATLERGEFTDSMEVSELEGKINSAIQKLPQKCKEVFELSRFEGKKYAEIAEHLNISVKTVEAQMSKALKVLKVELKDYIYLLILFLLKNTNM